ncbi:MAG: redox-regulated ATPase YchF [Candidatus Omnitrophica bacterium]|nr:redox-regulated ATPase YchF [Candidatus Omnitrophota bacterium]
MKIGIIGLPLSGKSTVFNALTGLSAEVKEFSSAGKIKPNLGVVKIPDVRLEKLAKAFSAKKTTPATIDFVDMAGISKDAKAEDMDLTPLRDTDALLCVVRFFENPSVPHPYNSVDGVRDFKMIDTEIILIDLNIIETRIQRIEAELKRGKKENEKELIILKKCQEALLKEKPLRDISFDANEEAALRGFQFLSKKPLLAVANIDESHIKSPPAGFISFCAKLEAEIAQLDDEELKNSFMQELGIKETARDKFILACFSMLNLIVFYTATGPQEARAWLIEKGATAYDAAGKVHSDIQRGFIRAEVANFKALEECGFDMNKAKSKAMLKLEGKDYIVADGDDIYFRFSV